MPRLRGQLRPAGQIRQSQVVTTFGPGAMLDLPDYSVIIGGLEHWSGYKDRQIFEDRLAAKVCDKLKVQKVEFFAPPADNDDPTSIPTGMTAWLFPEWFIAQYEERASGSDLRSRPLVHRLSLSKGQVYERDRKKYRTVPVRFVQACTRGHVDDVNWRLFVHGKEDPCTRDLWMDERGTGGDLTDIFVRCECGRSKALSAATQIQDPPTLGYCAGTRPWLGPYSREKCGGADGKALPNRLLVRSASNAYFAETLSVISIPDADARVRVAVDDVWQDYLQYVESSGDLSHERKKAKVSAALEGLTDVEVWRDIQRRKGGGGPPKLGIRDAEIETLLASPVEIGQDTPDGVFHARALPDSVTGTLAGGRIERVVKVHRLREVIAQVGFTRFESSLKDVNGELALDVLPAALSLNQDWVPAVENRGEGIFLAFRKAAVDEWASRPSVRKRAEELRRGFEAWRVQMEADSAKFPGLPYYLLHSTAHLLITAVSLDCGYAASSIRERIYATERGYGILLYTASPDSEGTLGGLVDVADRIGLYLDDVASLGELCSNDPVCAQHRPDDLNEQRLLLGAACHGCLLLPESSCERRNDFLDRALVVPTVDLEDAAFFKEGDA